MERTEFQDRIFDIINEAEELSLKDVYMLEEKVVVELQDGSCFEVECRKC